MTGLEKVPLNASHISLLLWHLFEAVITEGQDYVGTQQGLEEQTQSHSSTLDVQTNRKKSSG